MVTWSLLLGSLFGLVFSGMWLGIALGVTALILYHFRGGGAGLMIGYAAWNSLNLYVLAAVVCFVLMGQYILRSGIANRIYSSVSPLLARLPGRLLHTNIATCAMFAAVFGSSAATAAAVGSVAIPELRKRNYEDRMVLGSVCAGGTLGVMIPPSGVFIIYGAMTDTSVGSLFAAGMLPGIIMALLMMAYVFIKGLIKPSIAPVAEPPVSLLMSLRRLLGVWPLVLLMAVVLGPIYLGWATAVEVSGIGVLGAILIGKIFGKLSLKDLFGGLQETTALCATLFFVVTGAMILGNAVSMLGLPRQIALLIVGLEVPRVVIMLGLIVMYLLLGCLFDGISFLVMTLPFVFPLVQELGYTSIWFGVLATVMIEAGQLTPPVGFNLYVVKTIAGKGTSLGEVVKGAFPFFLTLLAMCAILLAFPGITLLLPRAFGLSIK